MIKFLPEIYPDETFYSYLSRCFVHSGYIWNRGIANEIFDKPTCSIDKYFLNVFTPEFLGRLDKIVAFSRLQDPSMEKIAEKYIKQLQERMAGQGITVSFPVELSGWIATQCRGNDGARYLRRVVQERVEGPLAEFLLRFGRKNCKLKAFLRDDVLLFQ